jgi:glycosyltransferase involved in cell wall biosynthesis
MSGDLSQPSFISIRVAILLSLSSFEGFYGKVFGLTKTEYLRAYRNDFSWEYARGLAGAGITVTIFLPSWNERSFHEIEPGIQVRFLQIAPWAKLWLAVPWLARTPLGRYVAELANAVAFWPSLKLAIADGKINILYVQEYWTGRFDFLARKSTPPIIAADHGGRKYRQIKMFKKKSFQRAAAITCQTDDEVAQVKKFGVFAHKLPNGIDTEFFFPDETVEREPFVLTVARLNNDQKRISDLIYALEHLPSPWRLKIAGSGPDEATLKSLVAEKHMGSRVEFLGFFSEKAKILDLYRRCGVFAMASAYEGIPMAVLEAMACGTPVVVSDIRAFQDVVDHTVSGYRVPVGDTKAIAEAIKLAFRRGAELSAAARSVVDQTYSRSLMVKKLIALIKDCLS